MMFAIPGLDELLRKQPGLRLAPVTDDFLWLTGSYRLDAIHASAGRVTRDFSLHIAVPPAFPQEYPTVYEVGKAVPCRPDWHVNVHDGSFCLGSRLGLILELRRSPNLADFLSATLDPYLYAVALKLETGRPFVFGELRHGNAGVLEDLAERLQIPESAVPGALALLAEPDAVARLQDCPCGCGRALGECETHQRVCETRSLESPTWFANMLNQIAVHQEHMRTGSELSRQLGDSPSAQ